MNKNNIQRILPNSLNNSEPNQTILCYCYNNFQFHLNRKISFQEISQDFQHQSQTNQNPNTFPMENLLNVNLWATKKLTNSHKANFNGNYIAFSETFYFTFGFWYSDIKLRIMSEVFLNVPRSVM